MSKQRHGQMYHRTNWKGEKRKWSTRFSKSLFCKFLSIRAKRRLREKQTLCSNQALQWDCCTMHFLRSNVTKVCMHACICRSIYIYVAQLCNAMYSLCSISTSIRICVSAHGCPLSVVLLQPCWLIVYDSSLYQSHCKHHTLKGTMRCMQQHWHGWAGSVHVAPLPLKFRSI